MNIFCTDKTGDINRRQDCSRKTLKCKWRRRLQHFKICLLNAYLQTGLKSNIDEAVVAKAKTVGIENSLKNIKK